MGKKLDKATKAEIAEAKEALRDAEANLSEAEDAYNDAMAKAWEPVKATLEALRAAREEAASVLSGVSNDLGEWRDERVEAWFETAAGEAFESFIGDYDDLAMTLSDMEVPDAPDALDLSDLRDGADAMDDLSTEPNAA